MAIPSADLERIASFCADDSPAEHAELARVEYEVAGSAVTLIEATKMDFGRGEEWLRVPLARLDHDAASGRWNLHCFNSDSEAMSYDTWEPDFPMPTTVEAILAEIDADPTNIFWG